jgi:hypothetical protein
MLSVIQLGPYVECLYAKCCYVKCLYGECRGAVFDVTEKSHFKSFLMKTSPAGLSPSPGWLLHKFVGLNFLDMLRPWDAIL